MTDGASESSTLSQNPQFRSFIRRRGQLNERLDESRERLDEWIQAHADKPSTSDIATLEGLLTARRDALQTLVDLDDDFISFILTFKGAQNESSG